MNLRLQAGGTAMSSAGLQRPAQSAGICNLKTTGSKLATTVNHCSATDYIGEISQTKMPRFQADFSWFSLGSRPEIPLLKANLSISSS